MAGYGWYDGLEKVTELAINIEAADGTVINLEEAREDEEMPCDEMARAITLRMTLTQQESEDRTVELTTDLALFDTDLDWLEDCNNPIVTKTNRLDADQLTDLLIDSYFSPSDDPEADSYGTQQDQHKEHFARMARSLLVTEEDAVLKAVQSAVGRHVRHQLPRGWTVSIEIDSEGAVAVSLTPAQ